SRAGLDLSAFPQREIEIRGTRDAGGQNTHERRRAAGSRRCPDTPDRVGQCHALSSPAAGDQYRRWSSRRSERPVKAIGRARRPPPWSDIRENLLRVPAAPNFAAIQRGRERSATSAEFDATQRLVAR